MRLLPLVGLAFATTAHAQTLEITTTRPATCTRKTTNGDVVSMQYRGSLQADGSVFDSSYGRNAPFSFTLGSGQVIAGWDQGLLGMCIGEARKLVIPPALAYGQEGVGPIPPGATLIFETELVAIQGVEPEPQDGDKKPTPKPKPESKPSPTQPTTPPQTQYTKPTADPLSTATAPIASAAAVGSPKDGEDKGECNLLGDFALLVQGALGLLAVSSLAVKRMREHPRRPLKIWFFDVSKQVFGSVLLHLANILMSMLSSGQFDVVSEVVSETASTNSAVPAGAINEDAQPNPCSFYLLNLAIDTTIGIPVLVLLLKLLHRAFLLTPLASPPESIRSGNYGHPPRATWWLKQSIIYFLGLIGMKLCVLALFTFLPWIAWVGDWALRWTEGNTALQIAFVMFVFPLVMNALQYWIIDGFIKERSTTDSATSADRESQGEYHAANTSDDEDDDEDEWQDRTARRQPLKEANPTVVPSREEYDPDVDGVGRPGKSRRE